jgi:hypothetical protein
MVGDERRGESLAVAIGSFGVSGIKNNTTTSSDNNRQQLRHFSLLVGIQIDSRVENTTVQDRSQHHIMLLFSKTEKQNRSKSDGTKQQCTVQY